MRTIKKGIIGIVAVLAIASSAVIAAPVTFNKSEPGDQQVSNKVRKELVTLPY